MKSSRWPRHPRTNGVLTDHKRIGLLSSHLAAGGEAHAHSDSQGFVFFLGGGVRPRQAGDARSPEGTREISRNHGSELSDATIVPQNDEGADMRCSEDELNLMPGNAVGTATPEGIPVCYRSTRRIEG